MSSLALTTITERASGDNVPVATLVAGVVKAWVLFDGSGTPTILDDFNVDSLSDNGTGLWSVNFTNDMPNVNYAVMGSGTNANNTGGNYISVDDAGGAQTVSACRIQCWGTNAAASSASIFDGERNSVTFLANE